MYDFTVKQWMFLKGNTTQGTSATYGYSIGLGIEDPSNVPAGRYAHTMKSMSSSNSFVIFGGNTKYSSTAFGILNDAWSFNVTSNNWCLLKGSITLVNQLAVYGTTGVASASNMPAGVQGHDAAFLPGTDILYVFGGLTTITSTYSNELWTFNCSSAQWTFLSSAVQKGIYTNGAQYPGERYCHSLVAINNTSLFIMVYKYGIFRSHVQMNGYGYGHLGGINALSDIWLLNSTSFQWYWLRGEESATSVGSYGTKNTSSSSSLPPGRSGSVYGYGLNSNKLIVYGGAPSSGLFNDVWYLSFSANYLNTLTTQTSSTSNIGTNSSTPLTTPLTTRQQ